MAENSIIGDSSPVELPQVQVPADELQNERNLAKFSQSKEFKRLKEYMEERIEYHQRFLPSGELVETSGKSNAELGESWRVANAVINELNFIILRYEQAAQVVKDARPKTS